MNIFFSSPASLSVTPPPLEYFFCPRIRVLSPSKRQVSIWLNDTSSDFATSSEIPLDEYTLSHIYGTCSAYQKDISLVIQTRLARSPLLYDVLQGYLKTNPAILINSASWYLFATVQRLDGLLIQFSYRSSSCLSFFISQINQAKSQILQSLWLLGNNIIFTIPIIYSRQVI